MERYTWLRGRRGSNAPTRGVLVIGAVVLALLLPGAVDAAAPQSLAAGTTGVDATPRAATAGQKAHTASMRRGVRAHVTPTRTAPKLTRSQLRGIQEMNQEEGEQLPAVNAYHGPLPRAVGRPASVPSGRSQAAGDFTYMENRVIPFFAGSFRSGVSEPSTDASGRMRFLTSNWQAARSVDGGATWGFVNPFANYAGFTNFCCDQVTVYDASHDRWFWLRQYGNHLEISNSRDLVNWCTYNLFPSAFGLANASNSFDYNHLGLSTSFLYLGTHDYGPTSQELIARFPIDAWSQCAGYSYSWLFRTDTFAESFVNGAGDTMYWGSNWVSGGGLVPGSGFRVFSWADNSGTYFWYDRGIDAYAFESFGTGNCGSADGVVLNWCQRTDSRMSGNGYISFPSLAQNNSGGNPTGDAVIGFAFNARQDASHPFPYIRRIYFRSRDIAYLGRSEFYANWGALQYPDLASNARGHVGMVWAWGGGTGTTHYFPGWGVLIDDDVSPTQAWNYSYTSYGAGNPCLNTADGRRRWGDYLTIHPMSPARLVWVATGFRMNAATNCTTGQSTAQVELRTVIYGRQRDIQSWARWFNK